MPEAVALGATLFLVVRLGDREDVPAPRVALRGRVVRIEPHPSSGHPAAVAFTRYGFLKRSAPRAGADRAVTPPRGTPEA